MPGQIVFRHDAEDAIRHEAPSKLGQKRLGLGARVGGDNQNLFRAIEVEVKRQQHL